MKVRLDHVTNSSTSSYIIGVRGELTKERLLEVFGVPESSPLYSLAKDLVDIMVADADEWSKEDVLEQWDELWGILPEIFDAGMKCYIGSASSEGETLEQLLCYMPFDYRSEDLILNAGGGY